MGILKFLTVHPFPWEQSKEPVPRTVAFPSHPTGGVVQTGMSRDPVISQTLSNKQSRESGLS